MMTAVMVQIAAHEAPPDADFLVAVDLGEHGMPGRGEQLWSKQVGPTRFILRSIPFFAYGMRPGDEIETDESFMVQRVVARSGFEVLRLAVETTSARAFHDRIHPTLDRLGLLHEWRGQGYVAIRLPDTDVPAGLTSVLTEFPQIHSEMA
jgi:hypothetical protein